MIPNKIYSGSNLWWQDFKHGKKSGQIAIIFTVALAIIFTFVAITLNIGKASSVRRNVSMTTDSVALQVASGLSSSAFLVMKNIADAIGENSDYNYIMAHPDHYWHRWTKWDWQVFFYGMFMAFAPGGIVIALGGNIDNAIHNNGKDYDLGWKLAGKMAQQQGQRGSVYEHREEHFHFWLLFFTLGLAIAVMIVVGIYTCGAGAVAVIALILAFISFIASIVSMAMTTKSKQGLWKDISLWLSIAALVLSLPGIVEDFAKEAVLSLLQITLKAILVVVSLGLGVVLLLNQFGVIHLGNNTSTILGIIASILAIVSALTSKSLSDKGKAPTSDSLFHWVQTPSEVLAAHPGGLDAGGVWDLITSSFVTLCENIISVPFRVVELAIRWIFGGSDSAAAKPQETGPGRPPSPAELKAMAANEVKEGLNTLEGIITNMGDKADTTLLYRLEEAKAIINPDLNGGTGSLADQRAALQGLFKAMPQSSSTDAVFSKAFEDLNTEGFGEAAGKGLQAGADIAVGDLGPDGPRTTIEGAKALNETGYDINAADQARAEGDLSKSNENLGKAQESLDKAKSDIGKSASPETKSNLDRIQSSITDMKHLNEPAGLGSPGPAGRDAAARLQFNFNLSRTAQIATEKMQGKAAAQDLLEIQDNLASLPPKFSLIENALESAIQGLAADDPVKVWKDNVYTCDQYGGNCQKEKVPQIVWWLAERTKWLPNYFYIMRQWLWELVEQNSWYPHVNYPRLIKTGINAMQIKLQELWRPLRGDQFLTNQFYFLLVNLDRLYDKLKDVNGIALIPSIEETAWPNAAWVPDKMQNSDNGQYVNYIFCANDDIEQCKTDIGEICPNGENGAGCNDEMDYILKEIDMFRWDFIAIKALAELDGAHVADRGTSLVMTLESWYPKYFAYESRDTNGQYMPPPASQPKECPGQPPNSGELTNRPDDWYTSMWIRDYDEQMYNDTCAMGNCFDSSDHGWRTIIMGPRLLRGELWGPNNEPDTIRYPCGMPEPGQPPDPCSRPNWMNWHRSWMDQFGFDIYYMLGIAKEEITKKKIAKQIPKITGLAWKPPGKDPFEPDPTGINLEAIVHGGRGIRPGGCQSPPPREPPITMGDLINWQHTLTSFLAGDIWGTWMALINKMSVYDHFLEQDNGDRDAIIDDFNTLMNNMDTFVGMIDKTETKVGLVLQGMKSHDKGDCHVDIVCEENIDCGVSHSPALYAAIDEFIAKLDDMKATIVTLQQNPTIDWRYWIGDESGGWVGSQATGVVPNFIHVIPDMWAAKDRFLTYLNDPLEHPEKPQGWVSVFRNTLKDLWYGVDTNENGIPDMDIYDFRREGSGNDLIPPGAPPADSIVDGIDPLLAYVIGQMNPAYYSWHDTHGWHHIYAYVDTNFRMPRMDMLRADQLHSSALYQLSNGCGYVPIQLMRYDSDQPQSSTFAGGQPWWNWRVRKDVDTSANDSLGIICNEENKHCSKVRWGNPSVQDWDYDRDTTWIDPWKDDAAKIYDLLQNKGIKSYRVASFNPVIVRRVRSVPTDVVLPPPPRPQPPPCRPGTICH